MFIVWRQRPVLGDKRTAFLRESHMTDYERTPWKPLWCEHRGEGRIAWTPLVMHSERKDGKPRQRVLERLPTIRSCCVDDRFNRAAWWHDVSRSIESWEQFYDEIGNYMARDKASLLAKLREVVPPPTPAGARDFATFRLAKEAERKIRDDADRRWFSEEAQRQQREREEARRATRGQWGGENARFWEEVAARFTKSSPDQCFAVLGLKPDVTLDEVKRRHRELAMKHHPDRGGDASEFARCQASYERACEILERRTTA